MPRRNSNAMKTRHTKTKKKKRKPARPMEYNRRLHQKRTTA